jgi:hypothetical protein
MAEGQDEVMSRRAFFGSAAKSVGKVAVVAAGATGLGAVIIKALETDADRFSTEDIAVSTTAYNSDIFFDVNFKGFGRYDDATLGVKKKEDGSYDLYVGVKRRHKETEIFTDEEGRVIRKVGPRFWSYDLKQFRATCPNRDSLVDSVHALLEQARDYVHSEQYEIDKAQRMEPRVSKMMYGRGITRTILCEEEKGLLDVLKGE